MRELKEIMADLEGIEDELRVDFGGSVKSADGKDGRRGGCAETRLAARNVCNLGLGTV
jgi:hypothetical protein